MNNEADISIRIHYPIVFRKPVITSQGKTPASSFVLFIKVDVRF
jgi:hypothetical protein